MRDTSGRRLMSHHWPARRRGVALVTSGLFAVGRVSRRRGNGRHGRLRGVASALIVAVLCASFFVALSPLPANATIYGLVAMDSQEDPIDSIRGETRSSSMRPRIFWAGGCASSRRRTILRASPATSRRGGIRCRSAASAH